MAIIDLGSGRITQEAPSAEGQPQAQAGIEPQPVTAPTQQPQQQLGRVIDLDTGEFAQDRPVSQARQAEAQAVDVERRRRIEALPELTGIAAGESKAKLAALTPVLLATTDPRELGNILSANFPNIGIQETPEGEILAFNNETGRRVIINKPGLSPIDVIQGLGIAAAFTPAAGVAAVPAALAAKVGVGAATAGLTQAAIEGIQSQVGGELDESEIAIATALGGAAELVVPAIQAVRQSRQAAKVGAQRAEVETVREAIRPAQEATQAVEQVTGQRVGLFPAQQTQVPSELLKQRILPQLDAGAQTAAAALERQNKEVFDATSDLLNTIAGPEVAITGAGRFRTAAQNAIQSAKNSRSAATSDLYREALDTGATADLGPVRDLVKQNLDGAPEGGEIIKTMKKIAVFLKPKNGTEPTLRQLQKTKFELDSMLEKFGENALGNSTKRDVVELKRLLVSQMEEASPLYKTANDEFARLSPAVTNLENSIIGGASKVKDVDLQNISRRIFSPNSNPEVVKNAKAVIDQADPGAWNDMLRTELQRRFGGIETLAEDIPGELVGNVPGQLRRAIFGNPEQRRTLLSAMNRDQKQNFIYLEQVLKRAASGRAAGSPTAAFGQALEKLRGTASVLRDFIFRPVKTLQETGERGLFDRNVASLTKAMFDPNFQPQMARLRALNPNSPAAARAFAQLLNTASEDEQQ